MAGIKVQQEVSYERIANLLCSAFDPASRGIGYWGTVEKYVAPKELAFQSDPEQVYQYMDYPLNEGGQIIVRDNEEEKVHTLDLEAIKKGLQIMADKEPRHFADILDENDDMTTADVFVQCALFGEVIYG